MANNMTDDSLRKKRGASVKVPFKGNKTGKVDSNRLYQMVNAEASRRKSKMK